MIRLSSHTVQALADERVRELTHHRPGERPTMASRPGDGASGPVERARRMPVRRRGPPHRVASRSPYVTCAGA